MVEFKIGNRRIGNGHPVYFIAEAGSNHDRNLDQAKRLIEVAADAGADAVKFQTFRAEHLYPRTAGSTEYLQVNRSIYDIIRDLEMPFEWIPELAQYCARLNIDFLSTPFDEASADTLEPFVGAYKIASYEMTHHGLVQHCARKGKPLIISTGTAYLEEVREVVDAVHAVGHRDFALLQCTARYPAPLEALNLRAISTLADTFEVPVGLSDHSREPLPGPMAAVALGASLIEKHFTLSNKLAGPDHTYALEPDELKAVIAKVREVERALGTGEKAPHREEEELRRFARRSIFAVAPIAEGARASRDTVAVLRCGKLPYGLPPRDFPRILGRRARRALSAGATLREEDFDDLRLDDGAVQLRPLSIKDSDDVVAWRQDPSVNGQLFSESPPTRADHLRWFSTYQKRTDRLEFIIVADDRAIGTIGLSNIDFGSRTADYGVLVGDAAARGRGFGSRASRLLLQFAFDVLRLDEVRLELFSDNDAAQRLYNRLGFAAVDERRTRLKNGVDRAVTKMYLRGAEWKRS